MYKRRETGAGGGGLFTNNALLAYRAYPFLIIHYGKSRNKTVRSVLGHIMVQTG